VHNSNGPNITSQHAKIPRKNKLTARAEMRRRKLLAFLRSDRPAWQEQDHPELASGTSNFVRRLRKQSDRPAP
jgi:hypothetical protein